MNTFKRIVSLLLVIVSVMTAFSFESFAARKKKDTKKTETTTAYDESKLIYSKSTKMLKRRDNSGAIWGFDMDADENIWMASENPWQRRFGYSAVYDNTAPLFNMNFDHINFYFTYAGKDWLIEAWKGRYGVTTGGEVGVYNKPTSRKIKHYDAAVDSERPTISFTLYNNLGMELFSRKPVKSWWCTGFVLLMMKTPDQLGMRFTIDFPTAAMCQAFAGSSTKKMDIRMTTSGSSATVYWNM